MLLRVSALAFALAVLPVVAQQAPFTPHKIYNDSANAKAEIAAALKQAKREHKNVMLDFGGNWCSDCMVLDYYMHETRNADLLKKNFVLVHVSIGQYDLNLDTAERYQIPLKKGVPALAILDSNGKLLFSTQNQEFEKTARITQQSVMEFLDRWKP